MDHTRRVGEIDLRHVYWIGGGSGAAKSTVARHLADRYGLARYSTDDAMGEHARRSTPTDCPHLHALAWTPWQGHVHSFAEMTFHGPLLHHITCGLSLA